MKVPPVSPRPIHCRPELTPSSLTTWIGWSISVLFFFSLTEVQSQSPAMATTQQHPSQDNELLVLTSSPVPQYPCPVIQLPAGRKVEHCLVGERQRILTDQCDPGFVKLVRFVISSVLQKPSKNLVRIQPRELERVLIRRYDRRQRGNRKRFSRSRSRSRSGSSSGNGTSSKLTLGALCAEHMQLQLQLQLQFTNGTAIHRCKCNSQMQMRILKCTRKRTNPQLAMPNGQHQSRYR